MLRFFNKFISTTVIETIGCAHHHIGARRCAEVGSVELTYRYFVFAVTKLNRFPAHKWSRLRWIRVVLLKSLDGNNPTRFLFVKNPVGRTLSKIARVRSDSCATKMLIFSDQKRRVPIVDYHWKSVESTASKTNRPVRRSCDFSRWKDRSIAGDGRPPTVQPYTRSRFHVRLYACTPYGPRGTMEERDDLFDTLSDEKKKLYVPLLSRPRSSPRGSSRRRRTTPPIRIFFFFRVFIDTKRTRPVRFPREYVRGIAVITAVWRRKGTARKPIGSSRQFHTVPPSPHTIDSRRRCWYDDRRSVNLTLHNTDKWINREVPSSPD